MSRSKKSQWVKGRAVYSLMLLFAVLYLAGCEKISEPDKHSQSGPDSLDGKSSPSLGNSEGKPVPIADIDGIFSHVSGWLNDDEIVYITNDQDGGSSVILYELFTGKSITLWKTPNPVISAEISPDSNRILVHSAPSSYEALITIIDVSGGVLFEQSVPSFELTAEWNQTDTDRLLITAFKEDWTYNVYDLNLSDSEMKELSGFPPFAVWPSAEKLYYLDWEIDETGPSLEAPLKERSLSEGREKTLMDAAHFLGASKSTLFAVQTNQDAGTAVYHFFKDGADTVQKLEVPQLSSFSGWIVPEYEWLEEGEEFLHFQPLENGEADLYSKGFNLVKYSILTGKQEVLIEGIDNAPVACSPDGEKCLYGFQFETLIDLETGATIELAGEEL